jgi:hypothetical protein
MNGNLGEPLRQDYYDIFIYVSALLRPVKQFNRPFRRA